MKKQAITILTIGAYLLMSCADRVQETHEHEHAHEHVTTHETHEHHNHEHHEHTHESHEQHNHHEEHHHDHTHETHEHHNHEHHDHFHEAHEHHHEGGISLKPGEAEAIGLTTETVAPQEFTSVIKCTGHVVGAAGDNVTVVAPQSGTVHYTRSWVDGTAVAAGTTLFTISSHHVGDGDVAERARISYETAKAEYERVSKLVKDKIVSQRDYEQAKERYEQSRMAYEAVGGANSLSGTQAKAAKTGYITRLMVAEGDYVEAGTTLATLAQNQRLQLRADVPQRHYKELPTIVSANFMTPYDGEIYELKELNGRLLSYARNTGETSFFIPVTFDFDYNTNIIPGSSVDVYLLGTPRSNVISLPIESLTEEQGLFFVYRRLCENDFEKVEVQLGVSNGSRVEILSGIASGDKIVTHGVYRVKLAANSGVIPEGHSHNH